MERPTEGYRTIDEYIATFPSQRTGAPRRGTRHHQSRAPDAEERISYQMPAFAQHGNLVYFAALKNHIGFYPTSSGIAAFKDELSEYEGTKGAVRFPIDQPLPLELISKIVRYRVAEDLKKAEAKASKKKA